MNWFKKLAKRARKAGQVFMSDPDRWLQELMHGRAIGSGIRVNQDTALTYSAVYACVRVLSESVASLPTILYRRLEKGKERAKDHPLYRIWHEQPNTEQSPFQYKEMLQAHLTTWGNAYSFINWGNDGTIKELWPLLPHRMKPYRGKDNQLHYDYLLPNEKIAHWTRDQIFHIPGLSYDGVRGYSPIDLAKESIGLGLAAERYGSTFFGNNARPDGFLKHPKVLTDEAHNRLKNDWESKHQGLSGAHRIAILEEGVEYEAIGIEPDHAQFLETRKFQISDIARIFRVPPHMIADLERATFTNIEHQALEFVVHTLRPWLVRWEQAITLQLLSEQDRQMYFAEFLIDALLRGDSETRYKTYRSGFDIGMWSANELREFENKNPREGGDVYYHPLNMVAEGEESPLLPEPPPAESNTREKRSANSRYRVASSYQPIFIDTMNRVVKREKADIKKALKILTKRDVGEFDLWLDEYYREFPKYLTSRANPAFDSLSEAIRGEVIEELGTDIPKDDKFLPVYVAAFVQRYTGSSQIEIKMLLAGEKPEETISKLLDKWEEKKPVRVAKKETVRASNAIAKKNYVLAGVKKLRWIAVGSDKCPFCKSIDGKVVEVEKTFVIPDGVDAGDEQMKVYKNVGHPPLHSGCVCQITAA